MIVTVDEASGIGICAFFIQPIGKDLAGIGRKRGTGCNGEFAGGKVKRIGRHCSGGQREITAFSSDKRTDCKAFLCGIDRKGAFSTDQSVGMNAAAGEGCRALIGIHFAKCHGTAGYNQTRSGVCFYAYRLNVDSNTVKRVIAG